MSQSLSIAVIEGDGIGKEVIPEGGSSAANSSATLSLRAQNRHDTMGVIAAITKQPAP